MGEALLVHSASLVLGDQIECEWGARVTPELEFYGKGLARGEGISTIAKALINKMP